MRSQLRWPPSRRKAQPTARRPRRSRPRREVEAWQSAVPVDLQTPLERKLVPAKPIRRDDAEIHLRPWGYPVVSSDVQQTARVRDAARGRGAHVSDVWPSDVSSPAPRSTSATMYHPDHGRSSSFRVSAHSVGSVLHSSDVSSGSAPRDLVAEQRERSGLTRLPHRSLPYDSVRSPPSARAKSAGGTAAPSRANSHGSLAEHEHASPTSDRSAATSRPHRRR